MDHARRVSWRSIGPNRANTNAECRRIYTAPWAFNATVFSVAIGSRFRDLKIVPLSYALSGTVSERNKLTEQNSSRLKMVDVEHLLSYNLHFTKLLRGTWCR
jgi:hypothetical protein